MSTVLVVLLTTPTGEAADGRASTATGDAVHRAIEGAPPEATQSTLEASCKQHFSYCRATRECCPGTVCRIDRYRGGWRCLY
jgi:hypothetical protein